jgi:hypothetical protein
MFACPTAVRVWKWVLELWAAVTDLPPPPLALSLLLADDQRQWRPPAGLQELWTQLRLATIFAIHTQAQARRRGRVSNAPSVAALVVGALRGAIHRDWSRVATVGGIQGLASGPPPSATHGRFCPPLGAQEHPCPGSRQQFGGEASRVHPSIRQPSCPHSYGGPCLIRSHLSK